MSEAEARMIEAELIERRLARDNLETFVQRFTPDFLPGWHITEMCHWAERLELAANNPPPPNAPLDYEDPHQRFLIVTMPPRHAKSQTYSKCLPLWFMARNPGKEVIVATYGAELSRDHGLWIKNTAKDPAFKAVFPDFEFREDSQSQDRLVTYKNGGGRFVGARAAVTGRGAHLLIIDDPIKNAEEADSEVESEKLWKGFWSNLMTRLAPGAVVVVMHTRWRTNDLIGRLLTQDAERADQGLPKEWKLVNFPAISETDEYSTIDNRLVRKKGEALHPDRYDLRALKRMEENMPTRDWLALYQQRPVAEEGNFFKRDSLNLYRPTDLPHPSQLYYYISTDFAVSTKETADYTCIWPYAVDKTGAMYFLPDFIYDRLTSGDSVRALIDLIKRYKPLNVQIEAGVIRQALGPLIEAEMQANNAYCSIVSPAVTQDKVTRAAAAQAMFEMGKIYLPDTAKVQMVVIPELLAFDKGEHDDAVDTISMAARCVRDQVVPTPSGINFEDGYIPDPEDDDEPEDDESSPASRSLFNPASWC
jgi:predicted phage terminase large subunit-like protein